MSDLSVIGYLIDLEFKEDEFCSEEIDLEYDLIVEILFELIEIDIYYSEEDEAEDEECVNVIDVIIIFLV